MKPLGPPLIGPHGRDVVFHSKNPGICDNMGTINGEEITVDRQQPVITAN